MPDQSAFTSAYKTMLGIPGDKLPETGPPDHYELLRLPRFEDDAAKIDAHYKKLNTHVRSYASGDLGEASQKVLNDLAKAMLCLTDPERKRSYDESLGREFAEEPDEFGRRPYDAILTEDAGVSRDQMKEAQKFADVRGLSLRDAAVQMKLVNPEQAARALAKHLQRPYVDLEQMPPEDVALDAVPRMTVKKHTILPLFEDEGRLVVACADEPSQDLEEELQFRFSMPMSPVITTPRSIQQAIATHYPPGTREEAVVPASVAAAAATADPKAKKKGKAEKTAAGESPKKKGGPKQRFSSLPEEEQKRRKSVGAVIMMQSFVIPMLVPFLLNTAGLIRPVPPSTSLMFAVPCLAAAAAYVTQVYWKWA